MALLMNLSLHRTCVLAVWRRSWPASIAASSCFALVTCSSGEDKLQVCGAAMEWPDLRCLGSASTRYG